MIRRTLAVLASLLGNGRPDDLTALMDATAEPPPLPPDVAEWMGACTCDEWTADELVALAPDLAALEAVETYADFLYLTGGDPE